MDIGYYRFFSYRLIAFTFLYALPTGMDVLSTEVGASHSPESVAFSSESASFCPENASFYSVYAVFSSEYVSFSPEDAAFYPVVSVKRSVGNVQTSVEMDFFQFIGQ